ncbi:MAG TPA: histidine--tRNA ligase [Solirubrobacterales bacterium]|nr:histidine--tRNA ligase [Solirubrobacterales bacterium]
MAGHKYQAPRGTFDVLPDAARVRGRIERAATEIFARAGYEPIATPSFEDTELFERGVGHSTDIVRKEMFSFEDKGGRSLTLRPEGTAPICRAYVEHGMQALAQPVKLFYVGPFFRHERPQAGRYRQFHQLGAEVIGSDSPLADAEVIGLLAGLLAELGVPGVELRLGSLGSLDTRQAYIEELKAHLRAHEGELAKEVRERIDANPLRAFDSDDEGTRAVMAAAPKLVERLEGEDAEHFAEVRALLGAVGVAHTIDPTLVRGLDYYTRTIFSFVCDRLGAQSEIGGGGRYDGLIEQLGGRPTPAVGWAAGIERIMLALNEEQAAPGRDVFIAVGDEERTDRSLALLLAGELRKAGLSAEIDLGGRGLKGQFKHADRIGARRVLILEHGKAQLRDMSSGEQRPVDTGNLLAEITGGEA